MLRAAPLVAASAVGAAWLRALQLEAEATLAEAAPTAQALLRLRIAALEYEAAQAARLLDVEV